MMKVPMIAISALALVVLFSMPTALAASGCIRGNAVDTTPLKVLSGTGYTTSGLTDAFVTVKETNALGTGTFVNYDFTFTNGDSGCGSTSRYQISVVGTGVETQLIGSNPVYQYSVVSATSSLGVPVSIQSVTDQRTGTVSAYVVNAPAGGKTTVRLKVEASSSLQSGVKGFGVVTVTATNLDAQADGVSSRAQGSGQITVSVVSECIRSNPTVRIDPAGGRSGFAGDQEDFLVTVRNENTGGCDPLTFTITQAGVQDLSQLCTSSDCINSIIQDTSGPRWSIVGRTQVGSSIIDIPFTSGGAGNTFTTFGTSKYTRFNPSQTIRFTLGSSDTGVTRTSSTCAGCEKTMILKVKSYVLDQNTGPRGIAVCVDQSGVCGTSAYNVLNHFETKPSTTDADLGITDSAINNPQVSTTTTSPGTSSTSSGGTTGGSGTSSSTTNAASSACVACTLQARKGLNTDNNQCLAGNVAGSTDGSASIAKGNWIYYPTSTSKNRLLPSTDARLKSSLSCDSVSSLTSNDLIPGTVSTFTINGSCLFPCQKFGYAEGQCYQGQQCVNGCIVKNSCTSSVLASGPSSSGSTSSSTSSSSAGSSCLFPCANFGYSEGQCFQGQQCVNGCIVKNSCTASTTPTTSGSSSPSTPSSTTTTTTSSGRVSVSTDKTTYKLGETVRVTGNGDANQFVTGELFDPNGNLRSVFQTTATSSSTYSSSFVLSTDSLWKVPGIWKIVIDANGAVTQGAITVSLF